MEPMFNFNGGARADLMAAVEELERHNEQESHAVPSMFHIVRMLGARVPPPPSRSLCPQYRRSRNLGTKRMNHCLVEPPLEMKLSFAYFPNHRLIRNFLPQLAGLR